MPTNLRPLSHLAFVAVMATSLISTRSTAQNDADERLVTRMDSAQIALTSKTKLKSLDRHLVPELQIAGAEIVGAGQQISVRYLARAAGTGAPAGSGITGKGKVQVTFNCISDAGTETLAKQTLKFDAFGNAATQFNATPTSPCTRLRVVRKFKGAITPSAKTLCLGNDGRFQVDVEFRDFTGGTKPAVPLPDSMDTRMFHFFSPDNWEMLLRVVDGCATNGNFWVCFGGMTNAEYELTVTDTENGQVRSYSNPLGTPASAILDTAAFATCP